EHPMIVGDDPRAQNHKLRLKHDISAQNRVARRNPDFPAVREGYIRFFVGRILDENNTLTSSPGVIGLEKTVGHHVTVKYIDVEIGVPLLEEDGILEGRSAAYSAAIIPAVLAGTYTLNHCNVLELSRVDGTVFNKGFKFELGQNEVACPMRVVICPRLHSSRCQYYRPVLYQLRPSTICF